MNWIITGVTKGSLLIVSQKGYVAFFINESKNLQKTGGSRKHFVVSNYCLNRLAECLIAQKQNHKTSY